MIPRTHECHVDKCGFWGDHDAGRAVKVPHATSVPTLALDSPIKSAWHVHSRVCLCVCGGGQRSLTKHLSIAMMSSYLIVSVFLHRELPLRERDACVFGAGHLSFTKKLSFRDHATRSWNVLNAHAHVDEFAHVGKLTCVLLCRP